MFSTHTHSSNKIRPNLQLNVCPTYTEVIVICPLCECGHPGGAVHT
mgnify:CR=1 FL=1